MRLIAQYYPAEDIRHTKIFSWPKHVSEKFLDYFRNVDQIWLDVASDNVNVLRSMMITSDMPLPAFDIIGAAMNTEVAQFDHYFLNLSEIVEMTLSEDVFEHQLDCGFKFQPLRYGNLGCAFGKKQIGRFSFPKRFKRPKKDLFLIAAGPKSTAQFFGLTRRVKEAFETAGMTGIEFKPINNFEGSESDFYQATISKTSPPRELVGVTFDTVCDKCKVSNINFSALASRRYRQPIARLENSDFQVLDEYMSPKGIVKVQAKVAIISHRAVQTLVSINASGIYKASAGAFEPIITQEILERANVMLEKM